MNETHLELCRCKLADDILAFLRRDVAVAVSILQLRATFEKAAKITSASTAAQFKNIFSRFYIAIRNEVFRDADQAKIMFRHDSENSLSRIFEKFQDEIRDKGMTPSPLSAVQVYELLIQTRPFSDLDFLDKMRRSSTATGWRYDVMRVSFSILGEVELRVKRDAEYFVRKYTETTKDVVYLGERIYLTVVLNYAISSSSQYWGIGTELYKKVEQIDSLAFESYASPFNRTLFRFSSPFFLDLAVGSLGSLYGNIAGSSISVSNVVVANPPYIESELNSCFQFVQNLLESARPPSLVMSVFPLWNDSPAIQNMIALVQTHGGDFIILYRAAHQYFDYQSGKSIRALFGSLCFVITQNADMLINGVRCMESLKCSTDIKRFHCAQQEQSDLLALI